MKKQIIVFTLSLAALPIQAHAMLLNPAAQEPLIKKQTQPKTVAVPALPKFVPPPAHNPEFAYTPAETLESPQVQIQPDASASASAPVTLVEMLSDGKHSEDEILKEIERQVAKRTERKELAKKSFSQTLKNPFIRNKLTQKNKDGKSPLMLARELGMKRAAEAIYQLVKRQDTSLHFNIFYPNSLTSSVDSGADLETLREGRTALHSAAGQDHRPAIIESIRTLVRAGANIEAQDSTGATPLIVAAMNGNSLTMPAFLGRGANVDATDNKGRTALHYAAEFNHSDIVSQLLEAEANPSITDKSGMTAADLAESVKNVALASTLRLAQKSSSSNAPVSVEAHTQSSHGTLNYSAKIKAANNIAELKAIRKAIENDIDRAALRNPTSESRQKISTLKSYIAEVDQEIASASAVNGLTHDTEGLVATLEAVNHGTIKVFNGAYPELPYETPRLTKEQLPYGLTSSTAVGSISTQADRAW